jgi:hypothetical protein
MTVPAYQTYTDPYGGSLREARVSRDNTLPAGAVKIPRNGAISGLRIGGHRIWRSPGAVDFCSVLLQGPTLPGVVLDPFGGTASAPLVAAMAGRVGISVDASWDYCDLIARWRINDPKERARAAGLDPDAVARIQPVAAAQGSLWDDVGGDVA